ncbi:MAG: AAA family ATPase [Candidatus Nealsonbacteria bacterium]|nr:AAA family ATPase [Candidatus Nealsonbacteria bacterium]
MRLTHVHIENFKRFERLDVELKALDCIVGPNNSGKTTLLQALALFDFCIHHCLSRKNAEGSLELKVRMVAPEDFFVLPTSDPMDLWTDKKPWTIKIRGTFDRGPCVTASVRFGTGRFVVSVESDDDSQEWLEALAGYRVLYLPAFSVFFTREERRTPAVINDELERRQVAGIVRNILLDLKLQSRHHRLVDALRRAFPELEDLRIEFDDVSDRYISVTYQEAGRPVEFDLSSAGGGFRHYALLFGLTLLCQPAAILLDEPDVHLHGILQNALLNELELLVAEGTQVLFATHSRDLISRVGTENIISLEDEGAKRLSVDFDVYDTLDRLGSIEPTQLPVIQAFQRVLIVEDQADWTLLSTFCSKCLGPSLWQQVERRLAVCHAKGNPYKQPIARLRDQLQQMISLPGHTLEAFVLSDRDYYPDLDHLRRELPTSHLKWHVWERAEIENYLLCPDAIVRLLRGGTGKQRALEEPVFQQEFSNLLESSRDSANDHLVEAFNEYRRRLNKNWDAAAMSRKAREFLREHWETQRIAFADAKDFVLPGIKRWLQEHQLGQFSNKALAEALLPEDLPEEVHDLARSLADFVGVSSS